MYTNKAKKSKELARGFGAGRNGANGQIIRPGNYKLSIEEIKKRT